MFSHVEVHVRKERTREEQIRVLSVLIEDEGRVQDGKLDALYIAVAVAFDTCVRTSRHDLAPILRPLFWPFGALHNVK